MAIRNFENCLSFTLREEGGLSNDPGDPGGTTNKGVTHARYDEYRASKGLYPRSVAQITDSELRDIYLTGYWAAIGAESLPAGVDLSAFDYAVNSGPNKARFEIAKARQAAPDPTAQIAAIANDRLSFLHSLATWSRFGMGWGPRVARIEAASLKMAGAPLAVAAASARAKADHAKTKSIAIGASTSIVATANSELSGMVAHGGWILLGVVVVLAGTGVIHAFAAWRQGQRASTLDQAIAAMQGQAAALAAAADAAKAQEVATAKNIAAEQADIAKSAAVRAAISDLQPNPPQVHR